MKRVHRKLGLAWTKEDRRAYNREWNRTRRDKEAQADYFAEWYRLNKEKRVKNPEHIKNWHKKNPLARAAHTKVRVALANGQLKKATSCQVCGVTGKRLLAHHENYSDPLDVVWLCDRCHRRRHVGAL